MQKYWYRLLINLALVVLFTACGSSQSTKRSATSGHAEHMHQALKLPGEAKMGDQTSCPVTKESFKVTDASPHAEYKGKTYYFCCSGCNEDFNKNPQRYVR